MEKHYIYLPLTIKIIRGTDKDVESWFYLSNETKVNDFLNLILDTNEKLFADEEGNNIGGKIGNELRSWTNVIISLKEKEIKKESNFLKNFSIEYYDPANTTEPAIITNHMKRLIKDSEIPLTSKRIQLKLTSKNIYILCKEENLFSIYQFDINIQNFSQIRTLEKSFFSEFEIKGISIWKDNLLFYNSREIFYMPRNSHFTRTIYVESRDERIERFKSFGQSGIILTNKNSNSNYSIKSIDLENGRLINEIDIGRPEFKISDIAVFGLSNYIISAKEGRVSIYDDQRAKSYTVAKKDEAFYDDVTLEMDDMNNLYILAKGRIFITDRDFHPKVSFRIEGAELISVLENAVILHSRDNALHKITLNPSIIS